MSSKVLDGKFLLGLGVALVSLGGFADTTWVGPGSGVLDGDWATATNWDNGLPDATGAALLNDLGSLYTVTMSDAVRQSVKGLTLTGTSSTKRPVLEVNGALVADGAKLTVDVSAFEGEPGYYKILDCTTRVGEFEDVELVGDTKSGKIVQGRGSDPSIYYCIPKGLMLILR